MITYADPRTCPACRGVLPVQPVACPHCGCPLRGETVDELFATLTRADRLVGALLSQRVSALPSTVAPSAPGRPVAAGDEGHVGRGGPHVATVPAVLLSLGALALLGASLVFLAFAWAWLGVGGRTSLLVLLTAAFAAAGWVLARRELRMAGEAFLTIALGLLVLDLTGADSAGWFGERTGPQLASIVALSLLVVGSATTLLFPRLGVRRPWAPQVVAAAATLAAPAALLAVGHPFAALAGWVLVALLLATGLAALDLPVVAAGALASAVGYWLPLVAEGLRRSLLADHADYLRGPEPWLLLAAAGLVALPAIRTRRQPLLAGGLLGIAAGLVTLWMTLPALSGTWTSYAVAALAALVVWVGAAAVVPARWWPVVALPGAGSAALALGAVVLEVGRVADRWESVARARRRWDFAVAAATSPHASWLLVLLVAALLGALTVGGHRSGRGWPDPLVLAAPLLVALAVVLAAYGLPVAVSVALTVVASDVLALVLTRARGAGSRVRRTVVGGVAVLLGLGAVLAAYPSTGLLAGTAAAVTAGLVVVHLRAQAPEVHGAAGLLASLAGALAVAQTATLLGVAPQWQALPVLVALGLAVVVRPRAAVEMGAAVAAVAAVLASLDEAAHVPTPLAVFLTVAGVAVTGSALLHPARRLLGAPGGLLLAAATWVRLADLGVHQPEAYTLPSALVLLALGLWWLRRDPRASTTRALTAGLTLATLPSLLWLVAEPASAVRALLLGAGCLGLVLVGAAWRWNAPLVIGAVVGAVLVLVELRPYSTGVPPWVLMGLAGGLLVGLGVTWEERLRQLRGGLAYLARLR